MGMRYPITLRELTADEGGGWLAEVQDLPGCVGDGDTREAAFADAEQAILEWVDAANTASRAVPEPSEPAHAAYSGKWVQRVPKSLHAQLADRAKREGVSINQLVLAYVAEGLGKSGASKARRKVAA